MFNGYNIRGGVSPPTRHVVAVEVDAAPHPVVGSVQVGSAVGRHHVRPQPDRRPTVGLPEGLLVRAEGPVNW